MGIHIRQHQAASRAQNADHLADCRQRVRTVMQVHVGEDGVQAVIGERQGKAIGGLVSDVGEAGQVGLGHVQHGRRAVKGIDLFHQRRQAGGHETGTRPHIPHNHGRVQVSFREGSAAHIFGEIRRAHSIPLGGDLFKIIGRWVCVGHFNLLRLFIVKIRYIDEKKEANRSKPGCQTEQRGFPAEGSTAAASAPPGF